MYKYVYGRIQHTWRFWLGSESCTESNTACVRRQSQSFNSVYNLGPSFQVAPWSLRMLKRSIQTESEFYQAFTSNSSSECNLSVYPVSLEHFSFSNNNMCMKQQQDVKKGERWTVIWSVISKNKILYFAIRLHTSSIQCQAVRVARTVSYQSAKS